MNSNKSLRIERALKEAGESFIEKYNLMKKRLLNVEYEHWAAGFAEGNNHGRGHIIRVLEYFDKLIGHRPLEHLDPYELFLSMMSILYHDIGLLQKREGHSDISRDLLEGDDNDSYIINPIDKEIIAAVVASHSTSKDIAQECSRFSPEEIIGGYRARPKVIAALVRLADELDEDYRRADPILQERLDLPSESLFFWRFCQRIRGIRPDPITKHIDFNLAIEPQDTLFYGPVPGGNITHFISFSAKKLSKINQERVAANRYLPTELQYSEIHVDVKPLRDHPTWRSPRTFVFNDNTTSNMFLLSYPELLREPATKTMEIILQLMREGNIDKADEKIERLSCILGDLPIDLQLRILYNKACIHALKLDDFSAESTEYLKSLDKAEKYLVEWFNWGQDGAFAATGRTPYAEVHRMVSDRDLATVCSIREKRLKRSIPDSFWPKSTGGGSSCIPAGTFIDTPEGKRPIENLRPGNIVLSLKLGEESNRLVTTVVAVVTSRTSHCVRLNKSWLVTPSQPVRTLTSWIEAGDLVKGDVVMDGNGTMVPINDISIVEGYFEVYDLTVEGPFHNYIANGLLCHNKWCTAW